MTITVSYEAKAIGGGNGDFQTNTYTPGVQLAPDVLGLSGGGFVSAYNNGSISDGAILLNFYDDRHEVIGNHKLAYSGPTDAVGQPKLAELANGNVLVVWDDDSPGSGANAGVRGAIYTSGGKAVSVNMDLTGDANLAAYADVDVAALDDGGFVVSYARADASDIFFRTYDSTGAQTDTGTVNTQTTGVQADTQVTVLTDGAFAITWTDFNGDDEVIKARIFETDGSARTAEFNATPGLGDNTASAIAALNNGGFAIVYQDTGWAETGGLSMQLVDSDGDLNGAIIHVNTTSTPNELAPDITVLENGFIAVSWTYPFGPTDYDVRCRVFDQNGNPVTTEFNIANGNGNERASAISAMLNGTFITSWEGASADPSGGIGSQITELTRTVVGDSANDTYAGDALRDHMDGGDGADSLNGAVGDDTLLGGGGSDTLNGGFDDDNLQGGLSGDTIFGGDGDDQIWGYIQENTGGSVVADSINGGLGEDRIRCSGGNDAADGGGDDDRLGGGSGNDRLDGSDGDDKLKGQAGDDTLQGGAGADSINGGVGNDRMFAFIAADGPFSTDGDFMNGANGHDTMFGSAGQDVLFGQAGKDEMFGAAGADSLNGGSGKDILDGGGGGDTLMGGGDKDTFQFLNLSDSETGAEDVILDLGNQDFIDLSTIDAKDGKVGNQSFELVDAFTGHQGELVVDYHANGQYAGYTSIEADTDGDGVADMTILAFGDRHNFDNFVF
jgi:Ca2+-binding RTX toxin-like protein